MSPVESVASAAPTSYAPPIALDAAHAPNAPSEAAAISFGDVMAQGLADVEARLDHADALVRRFAIDDSVPVHEVTIALEEARISLELALQVRERLVQGYRDIMNMQL